MNERNTKQKNIILKSIKISCTHPTAEEIYNNVSKELPNISLTTVYRNLNKLAEQGIIKRLLIPNQPDRFKIIPPNIIIFVVKYAEHLKILKSHAIILN